MFNKKNFTINESVNLLINIISENTEELDNFNTILYKKVDFILNKAFPFNKSKIDSEAIIKERRRSNFEIKNENTGKEYYEYIDKDGFKINNNGKKTRNIFEDLNYGDFVIKFPNSFKNTNSKKFSNNKTLERCYYLFNTYINLSTEHENLQEKDLLLEKLAFIHILLFYSDIYIGSTFKNLLECYNEMKNNKIKYFKDKKIDYFDKESEFELINEWNTLMFEQKKSHFDKFFEDILFYDKKNNEIKLKYLAKNIFKKFKKNNISDVLFKYLVKKLIILKFNKIGIYTRQTYSNCNNFIFVILKCQNNLIYERAEIDQLNKQLEIGKIDLFSLEPIDDHYRPFKLKNLKQIDNIKPVKMTNEEKIELINKYKLKNNDNGNLSKQEANNFEIKKILDTYNNIKSLDDENFLKLLKSFNTDFINNLDIVNKDLELKQIKNKEITLDLKLTREEWEYYLIFTINFNYWFNEILKFKDRIKNLDKYEGLFYR